MSLHVDLHVWKKLISLWRGSIKHTHTHTLTKKQPILNRREKLVTTFWQASCIPHNPILARKLSYIRGDCWHCSVSAAFARIDCTATWSDAARTRLSTVIAPLFKTNLYAIKRCRRLIGGSQRPRQNPVASPSHCHRSLKLKRSSRSRQTRRWPQVMRLLLLIEMRVHHRRQICR